MKQYIFYALCLLCGVLFSCDNERSGLVKTGTVLLGVGKNDVLLTKAGDSVTDEILQVFFINAEEDTIKRFSNYKSEVEGKNILLPVGMYKVCVTSAETNGPVWDKPNYNGETEVEVTAGEYAKAEVECQITNTKVTVQFTNDVKKYFSNYVATITDDADHSIAFEKDESRAAFFSTEKLTVDLLLVNKENGLSFNLKKVFPNIKPRYHYKLKFDVSGGDTPGDDSSGENLDVEIKEDSTLVDVTIKLPQYTQSSDKKAIPKLQVFTDGVESSDFNFSKTWIDESTTLFTDQYLQITSEFPMKYLYVQMSETFAEKQSMFDVMHKEDVSLFKLESSDSGQLLTLHLTDLVNTMRPNDKKPRVYSLSFYAIDAAHQEKEVSLTYTVRPNLSVTAEDLTLQDTWTTFAILRGSTSKASGFKFKYGKANQSEATWTEVDASVNKQVDGLTYFSTFVTGLESETEYAFRAIAGEGDELAESEDHVSFWTDNENKETNKKEYYVPNLNFENWSEDGNKVVKIYSANETPYWGSGNVYVDAFITHVLTNFTTPIERNGSQKAAKLEAKVAGAAGINKFGAGNLFTGSFERDGTDGIITLDRKCNLRPTVLRGEYSYKPKNITLDYKSGSTPSYIKSDVTDTCSIYIALSSEPITIKTKTNELFDKSNKSIIAYGELPKELCLETEGTEFHKFEIPLVYRNIAKKPSYLIIVCSTSKYGDYFVGGIGSILLLDNFELGFNYNSQSFVDIPELKDKQ